MTEFKSYRASFKATGGVKAGEAGIVDAYVSMFGNVDYGGDRMVPGAFTKTLEEWRQSGDPIPAIWSHDWDNPDAHIGVVEDVVEDETGLKVRMRMDLDRPFAQQVFHLLKNRRVREFSFGYITRDAQTVDDPDHGQVREIRDVKLIEVGPTLVGMNPATQLLEAASARRKTGRVLSAKNEEALVQARDLIDQVLTSAQAGKTQPSGKSAEGKAWQSAADEDLPINMEREWDGAGAASRVFAWAGWDDDQPDPERARRAFLVYDDAEPLLRGSYKLGFADVIDGDLVAIAAGLRQAAARRTQTQASPEALADARDTLDRYFARMEAGETSSKAAEVKATAEEVAEGVMVSFQDDDQTYFGRIEHVMTEGVLGVPESDYMLEATEENPAVLVRLFVETEDGWEETEMLVGRSASEVTVVDSLPGPVEMDSKAAETKAVDVPAFVQANAERGLRLYEEGRGGDGLVEATIRDARQMASGSISEAKVRRMGPWIARHLVDFDAPANSDPDDPDYPGPGLVAHLLWGSGPDRAGAERTQAWAERETERLEESSMGSKASRDTSATIYNTERLTALLLKTRYQEV